jgi:hypothetical protein
MTQEKENSWTIRQLSQYQIVELREMFMKEVVVETIARVDETGDLIIQHRGGIYNYDGIMKCTSIPMKPPQITENQQTENK